MASHTQLANFIKRVDGVLHDLRWTRADLAREMGISSQAVSKILGGSNEPRLNTLVDIAKALRVELFELLMSPNDHAKWRSLTQAPRTDVLSSIGDLEERVRAIEEDRRRDRKGQIAEGRALLEEIQKKKQKKDEAG